MMSTIDDSIEVSAQSVEEAVKDALEQLGAREDDVSIEVLATPRAGVLGLGARAARVRVTRRTASDAAASVAQSQPPRSHTESAERSRGGQGRREERRAAASGGDDTAPGARKNADLAGQSREAMDILVQILERMGERTEVRQVELDPETVELEIKGDGSGILIGRHGQTLDALEYLVNRILARRIKDAAPISLETESYRARRRGQLHRMALSMGERAKREHTTVRLEPMAPRDRRVVHVALKDDPMITTRSAGDGFMRSIEIVPAGGGGAGRRERGDTQGRGRQRGREREREREADGNRAREKEREPGNSAIGEQGGFKHGQKRIV